MNKFSATALAAALAVFLTGCVQADLAPEKLAILADVYPVEEDRRNIVDVVRISNSSHEFRFRSYVQMQGYVRKYASYCTRTGQGVPVKITDAAYSVDPDSLDEWDIPLIKAARFSCQ